MQNELATHKNSLFAEESPVPLYYTTASINFDNTDRRAKTTEFPGNRKVVNTMPSTLPMSVLSSGNIISEDDPLQAQI